LHFVANGLQELIRLLGREDERDGDLFLEPRDIEEGILLKGSSSHQETKEPPGGGEYVVHGDGLHGEVGPHVKEKGRLQGVPISAALMHIPIKEAEVVSAGA
jgi:hypothetical protein